MDIRLNCENTLACAIYERNVQKGFYEKEKNIGEMLCLIHSEVSEALEADRNRSYSLLIEPQRNVLMGWQRDDDFIDDYKGKVKGTFEEEMADIFIRLLINVLNGNIAKPIVSRSPLLETKNLIFNKKNIPK